MMKHYKNFYKSINYRIVVRQAGLLNAYKLKDRLFYCLKMVFKRQKTPGCGHTSFEQFIKDQKWWSEQVRSVNRNIRWYGFCQRYPNAILLRLSWTTIYSNLTRLDCAVRAFDQENNYLC